MLYKLIYTFHEQLSWLNVFRYITFRTILATLFALAFVLIVGEWVIQKLRILQVGQHIREDGPPNHKGKAGTPTMGGCLILPVVLMTTLLWAELWNVYVWLVLFVLCAFGAIGFADDYLKRVQKSSRGLSGKSKFSLQAVSALVVAVILYFYPGFDTQLNVPFFKNVTPVLGPGFIFLAAFIIVGTSNAVNLTDGLDGLAAGPIVIAFTSYIVFAYLAGNAKTAGYLQIPYDPPDKLPHRQDQHIACIVQRSDHREMIQMSFG